VRRALVAGLFLFGVVTGAARLVEERASPRAQPPAGPRLDTFEAAQGNAVWPGIHSAFDPAALAAKPHDAGRTGAAVTVRRISRDSTTQYEAQHATQVEPSSFAVGSTIVTAFQSGRFVEAGAAAIGWSTSVDAGKKWRAGVLAQQRYSVVSDPVVAYDAVHKWWLVVALGRGDTGVELWLSRSRDGLAWSAPVVAARDQAEEYDKEWVACDNGASSPYHGRCYLAYVDFDAQRLGVRRSLDGGLTWSAVVGVPPGQGRLTFTGPYPVVRPDGTLVIPYSLFPADADEQISAVVSHDGGVSFAPPVAIGKVDFQGDADFRAEVMPSAAVDAGGKVYTVWSDSTFREDGVSNDIVLSTSANGTRWTTPVRIPLRKTSAGVDVSYYLPAIAVAPKTAGNTAKLAVAVYSIRLGNGCATFLPTCRKQVEAWLVRSNDGGRKWGTARLLSSQPMQLEWIASSTRGKMIGDYVALSWAGGNPWAVMPLATQSPLGFSQSVHAATAP
jgi:hypothetical protein